MGDEKEILYDDSDRSESGRIEKLGGITRNSGIEKILGNPIPRDYKPASSKPTYWNDGEDAKQEGELQHEAGVVRVADSPEAEEWLSTKRLYEKHLGVTEYDELRTRLHLRDNESFTDYYNRTHYVPEGFEIQAKLLLAEEKKKKLYAEVEAGDMSEEDFLYEAYGKDLLKEQGIDFSSSLYWYNKRKNKDYDDPRKNGTFMYQLIENARTLFQQEKWYEAAQTQNIAELAQYVTGETLDAGTVAELFPEFFETIDQTHTSNEQIVKYYRAGLLQGFNPTIDTNGDGYIDYYYAPDGKLYNVNETGKGSNTVRAVYSGFDDEGKPILNRIVFADTYLGEVGGEFIRGVGKFFTGIVDLVGLVGGALWDLGEGIFTGEWDASAMTDVTTTLNGFYNSIPVLGERDYVAESGWKTTEGDVNWANIGRQASNLVGYIVPAVVLTVVTGGGYAGAEAGKTAAVAGAKEGAKVAGKAAAKTAVKAGVKAGIKTGLKAVGTGVKTAAKFAGKTAVALTKFQYGFGSGWTARISGAAVNAIKDTLQTTVTLSVNQERLGLSDGEIIGKSLALGGIDFIAGITLRSVGDESALKAWGKLAKKSVATQAEKFLVNETPNLLGKIALNAWGTGAKVGLQKAAIAGTNVIMDSMENVITAWAQTSLVTEGKLFSGNALNQILNSPQFCMNLVYQGYNTVGDMYRLTPQKVASAAMDALKMDGDFRNVINTKIAELEASGDPQDAVKVTALRKVLTEYDQKIIDYTNKVNRTPIEFIEKEDNGLYKWDKKHYRYKDGSRTIQEEAYSQSASKELAAGKTKSETKEAKLKAESEALLEEGRQNYSKPEAILKALEDITTELNMSKDSDLFKLWGDDAKKAISRVAIAYNEAQFRQIHQNHLAYEKLARGFFSGKLANVLYGKASREVRMAIAQYTFKYYYSKDMLDQYDILNQYEQDMVAQESLYNKLIAKLQDKGTAELNNIEVNKLVGDIEEVKDSLGAPVKLKSGATKWKPVDVKLSDEATEKYSAYYNSLNDKQRMAAVNDLVITIPRDGTEHDGSAEFENAVAYMQINDAYMAELLGDDSPFVKLDDNTYLIKNYSLGMTMENVSKAGLFVKALSNLKVSLMGNKEPKTIIDALQTLLAVHCDSDKDVDTAIEDNYNMIPSFIKALRAGKVFNLRDTAFLLKEIEAYYVDYNKKNKTAIELPSMGDTNDEYDKSIKLMRFIKDYGNLQDSFRTVEGNTIDANVNKKITNFLMKYDTTQPGNKVASDALEIALNAGVIDKSQIKRIKDAQNFMREKISTTLASLRRSKSSSSEVDDIDDNTIIDYIENIFLKEELDTITRKASGKGQRQVVDVKTSAIGTEEDFNSYLSSLYPDTSDLTTLPKHLRDKARNTYVGDTIKAIETSYDLDDSMTPKLEKLKTYLRNSINGKRISKDNIERILKELEPYKKSKIRMNTDSVLDVDSNSEDLNNATQTVYINLNALSGMQGQKILKVLKKDPNKLSALSHADNDSEIQDILFTQRDSVGKFNKELYNIRQIKRQHGSNIIELTIDSSSLDTIMKALGYNTAEKLKYTNGETIINGVYWNNNNKGVILGRTQKEIAEIEKQIEADIAAEEVKRLKNNSIARDPMELIEDASDSTVFIKDDTILNPSAIILNSLSDNESYKAKIAEILKYNVLDTKRGKNAGALFRMLLSSTKGIGVTSDTDASGTEYATYLNTYKIVNAFSELFDKKNKDSLQPIKLSSVEADLLIKTYTTEGPFIFTDTDDPTVKTITLNKTFTPEQFQKIVFSKIKTKKGIKSLKDIIPYSLAEELHNNVTTHEQTSMTSAYTTLTWLEAKLGQSLDIYDYVEEFAGIKGVDLSAKAYKKALDALQGKTRSDVLGEIPKELEGNIFYEMQRRAYKASKVIADTYLNALRSELGDAADSAMYFLGDHNARRSLGNAIRKALIDNKDSLKLDEGFIVITDDLLNTIKKNYSYSKVSVNPEQAEGYTTDTNLVTSGQLRSINTDIENTEITTDLIKTILTIVPLEASELINSDMAPNKYELILTMIKSASIGSDTLNISTKDLYSLDKDSLDYLNKLVDNDKLKVLTNKIQQTDFWKELHTMRAQVEREDMADKKAPRVDITRGDITSANREEMFKQPSIKSRVDALVATAKSIRSQDLYIKFSGVLANNIENNRFMRALNDKLRLCVVPFIDHPGSLQTANFNIAENFYYFNKNLAAFANGLKAYGIKDNNTAMNIAMNYYMYSTGMQQQGAHPDFIIIDKDTGNVVDIAMSGSYSDPNEGLTARLFNQYFELTSDGLHFKKQFTHSIDGVNTITVNPENLCAIKLDRNALNTTFRDAEFDIAIYDFKGHERQFSDMILDKINRVAASNNLDPTEDLDRVLLEVQKVMYERDGGDIVSKNRQILNSGLPLYKDSASYLIATQDQLSFLNDRLTDAENALNNKFEIEEYKTRYHQKEQDLNDIVKYGLTKEVLDTTEGIIDYRRKVNAALNDNKELDTIIKRIVKDKDKKTPLELTVDIADKNKEIDNLYDTLDDLYSRKEEIYEWAVATAKVKHFNKTGKSGYAESIGEDIKYDLHNDPEWQRVKAAIKAQTKDIADSINDETHIIRNKVRAMLSDYIRAEQEGNTIKSVLLKESLLSLGIFQSPEDLAMTSLKTMLAENNSTDMEVFKLLGCDIDILKNRHFETMVNIGQESVPISSLKNKNLLYIDIESFYNNKTGEKHMYEVTITYKGKSYTKYIKSDKVTNIQELEANFGDFFTNYYQKHKGSRKSIEAYLKSDGTNPTFDKILAEANNDPNVVMLGFNSKNFDIPELKRAGIITEELNANLLAKHVDLYDIVQHTPNVTNLNLHGGKATLEGILKQLFPEEDFDFHSSVSDNAATNKALMRIIDSQVKEYTPEVIRQIKDLYKKITGNDISDDTLQKFNESLKAAALKVTDTNTKVMEVQKHLKDIIESPTYYTDAARVVQTLNEKDIAIRTNVLIRDLNKQLALGIDSSHNDFAVAFSTPKAKQNLIDVVAYKLRDAQKLTDSFEQQRIVKEVLKDIANTLSPSSASDTDLISELIANKGNLLFKLGIDQDDFNEWKKSVGPTDMLKGLFKTTYGDTLYEDVHKTTVSNSIGYSLKPISDYTDKFDFLPDEMKQIIKNNLTNFYDYKGDIRKPLSQQTYLDLLSVHDKNIMDYLITDPVMTHSFDSMYRLAQTMSSKPIKLRGGGEEKLKNDTIYMTYRNYCELMNSNPKDVLPDPTDMYVPVIRYPLDKFDSIHYFKVKLIEDGQGIECAINMDTMLSKLNGDFDGDHINILRPSQALSNFAKAINASGKNSAYEILDNIMNDVAVDSPDDNIAVKQKQLYKLHSDAKIKAHVEEDLKALHAHTIDYEEAKTRFINKFKKSYDEDLLEDVYIKQGIDVADILYNKNELLYYTDLLSMNTNELNKLAKRAYTIAQMSKYKVLGFTDTQSGMFQKGFLNEDFSKYGDIDLIDNAMRLTSTTKYYLDKVDSDKFFDILIKYVPDADKYSSIVTSEMSNSDKLLSILRIKQQEVSSSKEYKTAVVNATKELQSSSSEDPFIKAYQRFVSQNTEDEFFKTIDQIVSIKKTLKGNTFSFKRTSEYMNLIHTLLPQSDPNISKSIYNSGQMMNCIYDLKETIKNPEDTVTFVGWTQDGKNKGAKGYQAVRATNTDILSREDIAKLKSYSKLEEISPSDVKTMGLHYNNRCKYYYVEENNGVITYIQAFNIDTAKTMTRGNAATKATPTGILDLSDIKDATMKQLIQDNNISVIQNMSTALDPKKTTSDFTSFLDTLETKPRFIKEDGTITDNINDARYVITTERKELLELPLSWNQQTKKTSFEESAYGNNMLGTGGIGMTHGIWVDQDELGNNKLVIDNSKYLDVKRKINSLSEYDRHLADPTNLYEQLALAAIIKALPPEELEGTTKKDMYLKHIANDARTFIHNHLSLGKEMTGIDKKLVNLDTYNRIYGLQKAIVDSDGLPIANSSGSNIENNKLFTQSKRQVKGQVRDLYNLGQSPEMSKVEFINLLNEGNNRILTDARVKEAEKLGLLSNRKIKDFEDPYSKISNTDPKIGQIFQKGIEARESDGGIFKDYGENFTKYYDQFNYETDTPMMQVNGRRLNSIYNTNMFKDIKDPTNTNKDIKGMRLANIVSSLFDIDGTYKSKDIILQKLNPNMRALFSVSLPQLQYQGDGSIKYTQRRINLGDKGYRDIPISDARAEIYNQRRSPYYWDQLNTYIAEHNDLANEFATKVQYSKPIKDNPYDITYDQEVISDLKEATTDTNTIRTDKTMAQKYKEAIAGTKVSFESQEDLNPTKYKGDIVFGDKVGKTVFKRKPYGLNQGLALDSPEAIKQDRNIRQKAVDTQYYSQQFNSQFNDLINIAARNNCVEELKMFAYAVGLQSKLDDSSAKLPTAVRQEIELKLSDLQIGDIPNYIREFEKTNPGVATKFYHLISDINDMATKYSKGTNEPGSNIFFMLTPKIKDGYGYAKRKSDAVASALGTDDANIIPSYDSYDPLGSLQQTIQEVAHTAALKEHSVRIKRDGVIDSIKIQDIIADTFNNEQIANNIRQYRGNEDAATPIEVVVSRLKERFTEDSLMLEGLDEIINKVLPQGDRSNLPIGEAYMDLFKILSDKVASYRTSLDDALELANQNNSEDIDDMIYMYRQLQDIYAQLRFINKDAMVSLEHNLQQYAEDNNLAFVDKYGKMYHPKETYALRENSLSELPKELEKYTSEYGSFLVTQALGGNLFLMDKDLAETFADQLFVKVEQTKIQKALQKSSGWCVKMLMSSPFKFLDRFFKFTLFDAATLNTANHNTFFNQGKAYKDLRGYFSSKGSYATPELDEFLRTQGVSLDGTDFDGIISGDANISSGGLFKTYTDKVGNAFTFQTLSQRYAYWLATKKAIENDDYSTLGSAYHLRDKMKNSGMTAGEQASFAMAQNLGSMNDFPSLSKKFNRYGFVFTTFPLAAVRWGVGELRSATSALHSLFTEGLKGSGAKWIARNSAGMIGTLMLEQFLIAMIASMYGVDEDDEKKEEWEKVGALPNITQTLIQGQPIMDTFSSMNVPREVINMFVDTSDQDGESSVSGVERFIRKNIIGHINPIVKNVGEVALKKDLIDDQVIDTSNKYSAFENVFRKASSYIIGAAGANAMTKTLFNSEEDIPSTLYNSAKNAVMAELGNTKVQKENKKNYYKMLGVINQYLYADESAQYSNSSDFNYNNYNVVKSKLYELINKEAPASEVYETIDSLIAQGYSLYEVRSALKNCSVTGKLEKLPNYTDFIASLTPGELQNMKTALSYERHMFPWLDNQYDEINSMIKKNSNYRSKIYYYSPNYNYNNYNRSSYTIPNSSYNYRKTKQDSFNVYSSMNEQQAYQQQQAEYARKRKQWEDN